MWQRIICSACLAVLPSILTGCITMAEIPNRIADHTIGAAFQIISPYKTANHTAGTATASEMSRDTHRAHPSAMHRNKIAQRTSPTEQAAPVSQQNDFSRMAAVSDVQTGGLPSSPPSPSATEVLSLPWHATAPSSVQPALPLPPVTVTSSPAPPPQETYARIEDALTRLAALYRNFRYIQVLQESAVLVREPQLQPPHLALAYVLAASSAYLLGNEAVMRDFLSQAVATDASFHPNTEYFPSVVCNTHAALRGNAP